MVLFPGSERRNPGLARGGAPKLHETTPDSPRFDFTREHWAKALDLPPYLIDERVEPDEPSLLFQIPTNEDQI